MTDLRQTLRAAATVTRKDLRQRARDRSAWIIGIAAPLLLAAVLGQIIGGFTDRTSNAPMLGVVAGRGEAASNALVDAVLPSAADELGTTLTVYDDRAAADAALADESVDVVIVVPVDLGTRLRSLVPSTIEVVARPDEVVPALIGEAIVASWAQEVGARSDALLAAVALGADAATVAQALDELPPASLVEVVELAGADRVLDGATQVSAGLAVFFLFFTVQLGVVGLVEERQSGTLARLHAAPVPRSAVLIGKILTSIVIGFGATVVLLAATTWLLGASWGPLLPVLVLVAAAVLAAVSLVSVVAGFATSADAANNAQGVLGIVLGMLGGAFFPVATEPGLLATLSDLTPHGMFLTAVGDLQVPGAGLADIVPQLLGLLAFAGAVSLGVGPLVRDGGAA